MHTVSTQEYRRFADALGILRGQPVTGVTVRPDLRQVRFETADGRLLVLGVDADHDGRPRLEVDIVRQAEERMPQIEVRFDP